MKIAPLILFFIFSIPLYSIAQKQKEIILYESSRPLSFEFNNAKRVIGNQWGIVFLASNGINSDSLSKYSDLSNKTLTEKHGSTWNEDFFAEVDAELIAQNKMRDLIKSKSYFNSLKLKQAFIELQPTCKCKKKYLAKIVGQQTQGDKKPFVIYLKIEVKLAKNKLKLKSEKIEDLDFEYPSNGIVKSN